MTDFHQNYSTILSNLHVNFYVTKTIIQLYMHINKHKNKYIQYFPCITFTLITVSVYNIQYYILTYYFIFNKCDFNDYYIVIYLYKYITTMSVFKTICLEKKLNTF